jgi:L-fucose isomerase-like protein
LKKNTFGVIFTNRSFFPAHLVTEERKITLELLKKLGYGAVTLSEDDSPLGAVVSLSDVRKCAALFREKSAEIDGIIVVLPNFGEESAVASAIEQSGLKVPVLVHASDDRIDRMQFENRRDAFCGKISVCNNLYQRGIKYTLTTTHTSETGSGQFAEDLRFFAGVCRVVKGVSTARIGAIGARPDAFHTVRFSEKLLQDSGVTVVTTDLSDIIFGAMALDSHDAAVLAKAEEIFAYGRIPEYIGREKLIRQAKLCIVLEEWVRKNECDASAIQCWDSIQNHYGCATCLAMSMMGEKGLPSACEMDVTGALTMYAMQLASGEPSGYLDWNNNYSQDRDKCVCLHCSNFPKSFFGTGFEISNLDVLGTTIGADKCFGACKAQIAEGPMTYAKISTDDRNGKIRMYVGEGEILGEKVNTPGGVGLFQIPELQQLMKYICKNGFEHHVAMNRTNCARVLEEAFENYLGWEVYCHGETDRLCAGSAGRRLL